MFDSKGLGMEAFCQLQQVSVSSMLLRYAQHGAKSPIRLTIRR
ncbi:hypothetical protein ACPOL_5817 [Acidisarcina polymorpha]|uniref:Uncharacterized protein n=1 Tax=Acidisarcina polymorpha TaxID=2211140 RepID=A0A2Z5G713_9BACT|nr:hypothetical protein ACPOL_5817 [Acidisarcina polymorpha]